jgi:hypothetical protein
MTGPFVPEEILTLSERCIAHIQKRFGVTPDFSSETLSLLDHFVDAVTADEGRGQAPAAGHPLRMNLVHLFAPTLGAFFGETLRRQFGGRWRFAELAPLAWRLEFDTFFVRVNPAGIAANVLAAQALDDWAGALVTAPPLMDGLRERLAAAPAVADEDFFSFGTAFESIQIAREYLLATAAPDGSVDCSENSYDLVFGR